jgi:hypothetical protein
MITRLYALCCLFVLSHLAMGQVRPQDFIEGQSLQKQYFPQTKIYAHTDRTLLSPGDHLWFTVYHVDDHFNPSYASTIVLVEWLNPAGQILETRYLPLKQGLALGDWAIPADAQGGIYKLRIYSPWTLNRGIDKSWAYEKKITIQKYTQPNLVLKLDFVREVYGAGAKVEAEFEAKNLKNEPIVGVFTFVAELEGKSYAQGNLSTDAQGKALISFTLPNSLRSNNGLLNIKLKHLGRTESISRNIPISLNSIDLQFLPEGGYALLGMPNHYALKALNEWGKPADVTGYVRNQDGVVVAEFKSYHQGMGGFVFTPQPGEIYTAHLTEPTNNTQAFMLPAALAEGANLQVKKHQEHLEVLVHAQHKSSWHLFLRMQDSVWLHRPWVSKPGENYLDLPTAHLPMGMAEVVLMDEQLRIQASRLVFLNANKQLQFEIKTDKTYYLQGEDSEASLSILVKDHQGNPVPNARFSFALSSEKDLAFADDKQPNILAQLLLQSEIKAEIFEPNFYFDPSKPKADSALDYLLLTQGWRRYEWRELLHKTPTYWQQQQKYEHYDNFLWLNLVRYQDYSAPVVVYNRLGDSLVLRHFYKGIYLLPRDFTDVHTLATRHNGRYIRYDFCTEGERGYRLEAIAPEPWEVVGAVSGTVQQTKGLPVTVSLLRQGLIVQSMQADTLGRFQFGHLAPGEYALQAEIPGVMPVKGANFTIQDYQKQQQSLAFSAQLDYAIKLERYVPTAPEEPTKKQVLEDSVTVVDAVVSIEYTRIVEVDNTSGGNVLSAEDIERMPTRRLSAPNTAAAPKPLLQKDEGELLQAKGSRESSNDVYIDGVRQTGALGVTILDADEFEAETEAVEIMTVMPTATELGGTAEFAYDWKSDAEGPSADDWAGEDVPYYEPESYYGAPPPPPPPPAPSMQKMAEAYPQEYHYNDKPLAEYKYIAADRLMAFNSTQALQQVEARLLNELPNLYAPILSEAQQRRNRYLVDYAAVEYYEPQDFLDLTEEAINQPRKLKTLYWEHELNTDEDGLAKVDIEFGQQWGSYRMTLEGFGQNSIGRLDQVLAVDAWVKIQASAPPSIGDRDVVEINVSIEKKLPKAIKVEYRCDCLELLNLPATQLKDKDSLLVGKIKAKYKKGAKAQQCLLHITASQKDNPARQTQEQVSIQITPSMFKHQAAFASDAPKKKMSFFAVKPQDMKAIFTVQAQFDEELNDAMQGLLRQPTGCFEQTTSATQLNLLALTALQGQTGHPLYQRARQQVKEGYQRLQTFAKEDGGFDWYGGDKGLLNLTAQGLLFVTEMKRFETVPEKDIQKISNWILQRRDGQGNFYLNDNKQLAEGNRQLTQNLFALYALSRHLSYSEVKQEFEQAAKALRRSEDLYQLGLLCLSAQGFGREGEARDLVAKIAKIASTQNLKRLSSNGPTAFSSYGQERDVEALALAIMALVANQDAKNDAALHRLVSFLYQNKQGRGFGHTQADQLAFRALAAYRQRFPRVASESRLQVYVNGKRCVNHDFKQKGTRSVSFDLSRFIKPGKRNDIEVRWEGGKSTLPYRFEAEWQSTEGLKSAKTPLEMQISIDKKPRKVGDVLHLRASIQNKSNQTVANPMLVLGLPSGASPQPWQLKELTERGTFDYYEIKDNILFLYYRELPAKASKNIVLDLRLEQSGQFRIPPSCAYPYYSPRQIFWTKEQKFQVK